MTHERSDSCGMCGMPDRSPPQSVARVYTPKLPSLANLMFLVFPNVSLGVYCSASDSARSELSLEEEEGTVARKALGLRAALKQEMC